MSKAKKALPSVYVVLLNWNGYEDTCRCILSLQSSAYATRIVVVDNDSQDRDIDQIEVRFPDVVYIKSGENGGFSKGNNIGIRHAVQHGADYVFVLNNDTEVTVQAVGRLVDFMESKPDAVCVSPLILYGDDPSSVWYGGGDFQWRKGGAISYRFNKKLEDCVLDTYEKTKFVSGCAMFIKASALVDQTGFDEQFFMYVEDVDMCLSMASVGDLYFLPQAKIYHHAHSTAKAAGGEFRNPDSYKNGNLVFYLEHVIDGYFYLVRKHSPSFVNLAGFYCYFYLRWLKKMLVYVLRGRLDGAKVVGSKLLKNMVSGG